MLDSGIGEISKTKIGSSEAEIVSRKINNSTGYAEVLVHVEESSDQVHKEYVSFAGEVKKRATNRNKTHSYFRKLLSDPITRCS